MDAKSVRGAEGPGRDRELTLTKILNAPPSLVFRTWTESKHLAQWWGPAGFTNPICEIDLRVGGEWSIVMRSPDGKEQTVKGVYREIIPYQKLVFTNLAVSPAGDLILEGFTSVLFEDLEGNTKLTLHSRVRAIDAEAASRLDGMDAGWSQSLQRLLEHLACEVRQEIP